MNPHPHELAPLLLALGRAGIELAPHPTDPQRLRVRRATPTGWAADLPADLAAQLAAHKPHLLALLTDGCSPDFDGDPEARYVCFERLGVADDLGLPIHPGSPAYLVAVGEALALAPNPVYTPSNKR